MKKVLLKAYFNNNLGDDLFVKVILDRYKNNFYVYSSKSYSVFSNYKNIFFCANRFTQIVDKFMRKIVKKFNYTEIKNKTKYDALVYVGGSLFMETEKQNLMFWKNELKQYKKNCIDSYIIGSNFGPYAHTEFLDLMSENVIKNVKDICFRDKYSYELFKEKNNVRYAPDILLSLKNDGEKEKCDDVHKVLFSIIDPSRKVSNSLVHNYNENILNLVKYFEKLHYHITFMSFCKNEGDERYISELIEKYNLNVEQYNYHENIDEAVDIIKDVDIIVGSRFHANVLGLAFEKKIIPFAYSDKTINLLKDINYNAPIYDIRDDEKIDTSLIEKNLKYDFNMSEIRELAQKHFEKIDEILEKKDEERKTVN